MGAVGAVEAVPLLVCQMVHSLHRESVVLLASRIVEQPSSCRFCGKHVRGRIGAGFCSGTPAEASVRHALALAAAGCGRVKGHGTGCLASWWDVRLLATHVEACGL